MKIIGVVGGIGSGKSTVVQLVSDTVNTHIINADHIGHMILKKGHIGYGSVVKCFGDEILDSDGEIDRSILGNIVFSDDRKLRMLNQISHPLIYDHVKKEISDVLQKGLHQYIVIDAALLIEIGLASLVDEVWGVYLPNHIQIERLMLRNGFSKQEAIKRISSQLPWAELKKFIDIEIDNSKSLSDTNKQILSILGQSDKVKGD